MQVCVRRKGLPSLVRLNLPVAEIQICPFEIGTKQRKDIVQIRLAAL